MTEKLERLNEKNFMNFKYFREISTEEISNQNKSLVGSILMWQS